MQGHQVVFCLFSALSATIDLSLDVPLAVSRTQRAGCGQKMAEALRFEKSDELGNPIRRLNWDTTTAHPSRPRKPAARKVKKPRVETTVTLDVPSDVLVISSDEDDLTYETAENSDAETEVSIASEWPNELCSSDSIEMLPSNAEVRLIFIFIIPALTCF
jgi:hypothetical protein